MNVSRRDSGFRRTKERETERDSTSSSPRPICAAAHVTTA